MKNFKKQQYIEGVYDRQEEKDIKQQGKLMNGFYDRANVRTGSTISGSIVDLYMYNKTGGTSLVELKYRDERYNEDSGTTMLEDHKLDFLVKSAKQGFGAFLYNMYKNTDEMHLFYINAIIDELKKLRAIPTAIHWDNGFDSGIKLEDRYYIPNRLAYKIIDGEIVSFPEDNRKTMPPKRIEIDAGIKISDKKTDWIIDGE